MEPQERKRSFCGCIGLCLHRCARFVIFLCVLCIVLFLALYVALVTIGLPRFIVGGVILEAQKYGYSLGADRIRLVPPDRVVVEGIRVAAPADETPALILNARSADLEFEFGGWPWLKPAVRRVRLENGTLRWRTERVPGQPPAPPLVVSNVALRYDVDSESLSFCDLAGECLGVAFHGYGRVVSEPPPAGPPAPAGPRRFPRPLPPITARIMTEIREIDFTQAPSLRASFEWHPRNPGRNSAMVFLEGAGTRIRNMCLEEWQVAANWRNERVLVPLAVVRQGMEALTLSGSYDTATRQISGRLSGKVMPAHWMEILPRDWQSFCQARKLTFKGQLEFDASVTRCLPTEVTSNFSGWATVNGLDADGLWVERAFAAFSRKGELINLKDVSAVIGQNVEQGPLQGSFRWNLSSREYEGQFDVGVDPRPILERMGARLDLPPILFKTTPPELNIDLHGRSGHPEDFSWAARIRATDFIYNGEPVVFFDSRLSLTNEVLTFDPLLLVRFDGSVSGRLRTDFRAKTVDLDLVSTASPHAVARIQGPVLERLCQPYRFEGPVRISARGTVDYDTGRRTDLTADVSGERLGTEWFLADAGSFRFHLAGSEVELEDISGRWCGGSLTGRVSFAGINDSSNVQYHVTGAAADMDFQEVARVFTPETASSFDGRLSGACDLAGIMGAGRGDTVVGHGAVKVTRGALMQIPLLGGLSKSLSRLYPGMGYTQQRKFESSFDIRDRRFHTEDAQLEGHLMTIKGRGDYGFGGRLDFKVVVHPLENGMVADAVRIFTALPSKLFEFHLGGTASDPKWEALSLPRELLGFFEGLPFFRFSTESDPRP